MALECENDTKINFEPSSFRNMNARTANGGGSTSGQADFFLIGNTKKTYANQLRRQNVIRNKALQNIVDKLAFLRMNICRYNHDTNLINLIGYVQDTDVAINTPNMQGWRGVSLEQQNLPYPNILKTFMKNINDGTNHKGILVDLTSSTLV